MVCGEALLPKVTVPGPLATCHTVERVAPDWAVYVTVPLRVAVAVWLMVWFDPAETTGGGVVEGVDAGLTVIVTVELPAMVPSVAERSST